MADNYLERRMEDLRNGKSSSHYHTSSPKRKGFNFPCAPKRVLIATNDCQREDFARAFLKADFKVAMMHDDKRAGDEMARKEGIRYYPIPIADCIELKDAFMDLLSAWRDVDIIICDSSVTQPIVRLWQSHRQRFPYVSDYVSRIIVFGHNPLQEVKSQIKKLKAIINLINRQTSADITDLVLTLILPKNHIISNMKFAIN